jgi:cytochrome P450
MCEAAVPGHRLKDAAVDFSPSSVVDGRGDVGCPVVHFDFTVARGADAYVEIAKLLRERSPSYFNTLAQGFWMVTTYDAVHDLFTRGDLFSSRSFDATNPDPGFQLIPTQFDGPDHLEYRRILSPSFSAAAVSAREPEIRACARRLVEELASSGGGDVTSRFCLRLATEVHLLLVGQPVRDAEQMAPWVEAVFSGSASKRGAAEPMDAALAGLREYYRAALDLRRSRTRDHRTDFLSHLLTVRFNDRNLAQEELDDICHGMTMAILDPSRALRYLLEHLADHKHDRDRLNADMSLVPTAIEESLRYHPLVWEDARRALRDDEFYGCRVRKGDMVLGVIAAANRDPSRYAAPDRFLVDRTPKPSDHLSFAAGPHKCLGLHLARLEMRVALEEWHRVIPDYELESARHSEARTSQFTLFLKWDPPGNGAASRASAN